MRNSILCIEERVPPPPPAETDIGACVCVFFYFFVPVDERVQQWVRAAVFVRFSKSLIFWHLKL